MGSRNIRTHEIVRRETCCWWSLPAGPVPCARLADEREHCLETSGVQEVFKVLVPLLTLEADGWAGNDMGGNKNSL